MVLPTSLSNFVTVILLGFTGELHHETMLNKNQLLGHVTRAGLFYEWAYTSKDQYVYKQMAVTAL